MLCLVLVSFSACQSTPTTPTGPPAQELITIQSYLDPQVRALTRELPPDATLFVFDIDNTLLESPPGQFVGSDQWYKWQTNLDKESPRKVDCVLQFQGAAYYMAHLNATEDGASTKYVNSVQQGGFDVLALTARSPQFRASTERELEANGFDFAKSLPAGHSGFPGTYTPDATDLIEKPRAASYQQGIAMLAGQHKGAALTDLLSRLGAGGKYHYIVFFDDDEKNTNAMYESLARSGVSGTIFLYKAVDIGVDQYDLSVTEANQAAVLTAFGVFSRRTDCDI